MEREGQVQIDPGAVATPEPHPVSTGLASDPIYSHLRRHSTAEDKELKGTGGPYEALPPQEWWQMLPYEQDVILGSVKPSNMVGTT